MEINWFTFGAQIVNFLVLVWLLKRLLYKPVINAMDERERKIAARLDDADRAREISDREAEGHRHKIEELEHTKEDLLAQAGREVDSWKEQHRERARSEIETERREWYRGIQRERNAFLRELRSRAGEHVFETARTVICKLSDESLEERIVENFLSRLHTLDAQHRSDMAAAIRNSHPRINVKSSFPLSEELRQRILSETKAVLGSDIEIEFQVASEVICGLELQAAGYKVAWSAGETLDALEEEFTKALDDLAVG